jgi:hypothetical protein
MDIDILIDEPILASPELALRNALRKKTPGPR